MQFIRNDKEHYIDGVRYVSTKFKDEIDSLKIPHPDQQESSARPGSTTAQPLK
jgi:hypothetical protein